MASSVEQSEVKVLNFFHVPSVNTPQSGSGWHTERTRKRVVEGLCRRHGLTTIDIVASRIVENVESLFLTPADKWNTGHQKRNNEISQKLALGTVSETGPPQDILVGNTVHVTRVKFACNCVVHVVRGHEHTPLILEVCRRIICGQQVAVQSEETHESAIRRIMEGSRVKSLKTIVADISRLIQIIRLSVDGSNFGEVINRHLRLLASSEVHSSVCVTVDNFTGDEEVVLAHILRALSHVTRKVALGINGDLHTLIHTESINV
ncbi:glycosyltransferase family 5 protein [Hortaea werneckii]|nr:glycosyltransferase family 5 protein [Hortaea werneckii]